jgi:tetratricopeptide (TPR) repeat protein
MMFHCPIRRLTLAAKVRSASPLFFSAALVTLSFAGPSSILSDALAQARTEVTVQTLIGDAISDDPAKYADVDAAIKRFQNRDFLAARTLLERAKQTHSRLPPVDLMMAKLYYLSGQAAAGKASLELTARETPNDPEIYLILADKLFSEGSLIEADALYDKAIPLIDAFSENEKRKRNFIIRARAGRSAVATARQDWPTAIEDLRVWVGAEPEDANAHLRLGRVLFLNKETEEGMRELTKARELNSQFPNPYVIAAQLHAQLDDQEKARQTFDEAVRRDRNDLQTLLAYAEWLLQIGDVENAEKVLASARGLDAESLQALVFSGVAAQMAQKRKPAEDYYLAALARAPGNRGIINQLALLLVEQMDDAKRQRALQFAQMNAQLYPDATETNITLAWVLYQMGQNQLADQALKKGLQLGSRSADSNYLIAKMLADQERNSDARRLLEESLKNVSGIFVYRSDAQQLLKSL